MRAQTQQTLVWGLAFLLKGILPTVELPVSVTFLSALSPNVGSPAKASILGVTPTHYKDVSMNTCWSHNPPTLVHLQPLPPLSPFSDPYPFPANQTALAVLRTAPSTNHYPATDRPRNTTTLKQCLPSITHVSAVLPTAPYQQSGSPPFIHILPPL